MKTFVDTSAPYALIVTEDRFHAASGKILSRLEQCSATLLSTSFVMQETVSLLQARQGIPAVRSFHSRLLPLLDIVWIDAPLYGRAMAALLASASRRVSLTDWSSFEVMRLHGIDDAFAFDLHFQEHGFRLLEP